MESVCVLLLLDARVANVENGCQEWEDGVMRKERREGVLVYSITPFRLNFLFHWSPLFIGGSLRLVHGLCGMRGISTFRGQIFFLSIKFNDRMEVLR